MLSRTASGIRTRSFNDLREYFRTLSDGARLSIIDHLAASLQHKTNHGRLYLT